MGDQHTSEQEQRRDIVAPEGPDDLAALRQPARSSRLEDETADLKGLAAPPPLAPDAATYAAYFEHLPLNEQPQLLEPGSTGCVPGYEEIKQLIGAVQDLSKEFMPHAPLLELGTLPPAPPGEKRRPSYVRRLDGGAALDQAYVRIDSLNDAIHDVIRSNLQIWFDSVAGQACPLFEHNKRLASDNLERIDRWGFRTFMERKGELVQVRIDAKPARASQESNAEGRAASAGLFSIRAYDPSRGKTVPISDVATYPVLIVARSLDEATRIWKERRDGSTESD